MPCTLGQIVPCSNTIMRELSKWWLWHGIEMLGEHGSVSVTNNIQESGTISIWSSSSGILQEFVLPHFPTTFPILSLQQASSKINATFLSSVAEDSTSSFMHHHFPLLPPGLTPNQNMPGLQFPTPASPLSMPHLSTSFQFLSTRVYPGLLNTHLPSQTPVEVALSRSAIQFSQPSLFDSITTRFTSLSSPILNTFNWCRRMVGPPIFWTPWSNYPRIGGLPPGSSEPQ